MKYSFKSSFTHLFTKLDRLKQIQVVEALEALKTVFESGVKPEGLGLKRLRKNIWEIRSSLKDRVLFAYEKDEITFILVGNHNDIVRYLKNL